MTEFAVIYEQDADGGWSARAADLPVYAVGDTRQEAEREIRSAIALHLSVLRERGEAAPSPRSVVGTVTV
ncbi:MAG: type II toxin-antitoxin system HicB family antitoxin [Thermoleophilaceae bacterium]